MTSAKKFFFFFCFKFSSANNKMTQSQILDITEDSDHDVNSECNHSITSYNVPDHQKTKYKLKFLCKYGHHQSIPSIEVGHWNTFISDQSQLSNYHIDFFYKYIYQHQFDQHLQLKTLLCSYDLWSLLNEFP